MEKPATLNDKLSEAAKQARREYHAKWQREHPEAVRESHRRYWEKKAAALAENNRAEHNSDH